jgi:hypothetical protein
MAVTDYENPVEITVNRSCLLFITVVAGLQFFWIMLFASQQQWTIQILMAATIALLILKSKVSALCAIASVLIVTIIIPILFLCLIAYVVIGHVDIAALAHSEKTVHLDIFIPMVVAILSVIVKYIWKK